MGEQLVLFTWTNFILSSIQHGIQHGHCTDDMSLKYLGDGEFGDTDVADKYWDWLENHKTVNVRNGGDQDALREIMVMFERSDNKHPWGFFREDQSQNFLLTAVSIVLPESVFAWEPNPQVKPSPDGYVPDVHLVPRPISDFDKEVWGLISRTRHAS